MSSETAQDIQRVPVIQGAFKVIDGKPHLIGTKCSQCGKSLFPPRPICSYCLSDEGVAEAPLGNTGRLYAYTVIHIASKEFNPPYPFGYVILEPENVRVPTLITGVSDPNRELHTGMKMEMIIDTLRHDAEGNEIISFKFKPAATDG